MFYHHRLISKTSESEPRISIVAWEGALDSVRLYQYPYPIHFPQLTGSFSTTHRFAVAPVIPNPKVAYLLHRLNEMNMNYLLRGREMCSLIFGIYMVLHFYTRIDDVDDLFIVCTSDTIVSYSVLASLT